MTKSEIDDSIFSEQLKKYIFEYFDRHSLKSPIITVFTSGESLLADKSSKDIVFLDIEMPGMNGIYVGNELKRSNRNVIFFIVTSYMEYLDEAMRFHVFRYLSKPIDKQRLFRNTVFASDIISVESSGRKVTVHTTSKDYESVHTMQFWAEHLPQNCFFQTHRSYIVNLKHITEFDKTLVHLYNKQFSAYLTRRKYTAFKDAYLLYLESMR